MNQSSTVRQKSKLKLSIVTASYNQKEFLSRCLESIQTSTVAPYEHIINDNNSNDGSVEILEAYASTAADYQISLNIKNDKGLTYALNEGFESASGDIVCWLNTDEFYYPETISHVLNIFQEDPSVDMVFGNCVFYDSKLNVVNHKKDTGYNYRMLLYYGCYICSCSTFFRKSVLENSGYLDTDFKVCMDYELYMRVANNNHHISHTPKALAGFVWHDTNISRTAKEKRIAEELTIRNNYSNIKAPVYLKLAIYKFLRLYYIGYRVIKRSLMY